MRTKIASSFIIMALVCALVGGATFALFTSTATNAGNTFSAGTVVVSAGEANFTDSVAIGNMAPGDVKTGSFVVHNGGTLAQWFKVTAQPSGDLFNTSVMDQAAVVVFAPITWTQLAAGADATVNYTVALPIGATTQGKSGALNFKVDAEQYANNPNPELP